MAHSFRRTAEYPSPPECVWRALTDPGTLSEAIHVEGFRREVGHRFLLREQPAAGADGILRCTIRDLKSPERMLWLARGGDLELAIRFQIEPSWAGTLLTLDIGGTMRPYQATLLLLGGFRALTNTVIPRLLTEMEAGRWAPTPELEPEQLSGTLRNIASLGLRRRKRAVS